MHNIEWDGEQRLLNGRVREGEMFPLQRGIEALLSKFTPGFQILVDFSDLEELAQECIPSILQERERRSFYP